MYAKSSSKLRKAVCVVDRVSKAVGIEFGLRKCSLSKLEKGKAARTSVLPLPEGRQIEGLNTGAVYKCLCLEQKVLRSWLKSIWASDLNGKFKAPATNVWALSTLRYHLVVLNWSKKDLLVMDRMVQNETRRNKNHHKSTSVQRVHLPRSLGGRGIPSLIHEREREVVSTAAYLISSILEAVVMHQRNLFSLDIVL